MTSHVLSSLIKNRLQNFASFAIFILQYFRKIFINLSEKVAKFGKILHKQFENFLRNLQNFATFFG